MSYIVYPYSGSPQSFGYLASAKKWAKQKANESGNSSIIYPSTSSRTGKRGKGKTHHVSPDRKRNPLSVGLPRNKWVNAKVMVTSGGKIQAKVDEDVLGRLSKVFNGGRTRRRKR